MYYSNKNKEKKIKPIPKTYCEREEEKHITNKRRMTRKRQIFFILAIFSLILLAGLCNTVQAHIQNTIYCSFKNGAGNTWTCRSCGYTNYCWQISCSKCGKS